MRRVAVMTHWHPEQTAAALQQLIAEAGRRGATLLFDAQETRKHGIEASEHVRLNVERSEEEDVEMCFVLGGDGTILQALRRFAGTGVPVFAVNFGEIGFLASVEPEEIGEGIARAFGGEYELMRLPSIALQAREGPQRAINDIALHRRIGDRVADLAYGFDGQEMGGVRCDGLVVATPAGSTGYNLSNGGPIVAWGVEGFIVSFIAAHTLTARSLVVGPQDRLTVGNRSRAPLTVTVDGRPVDELLPGRELSVGFLKDDCAIAQLPGSTFYRRLREKFDRLAR